MDFAAPPAVIGALEKRVAHGIFGYGKPWPSLVDTTLDYLKRHYDWHVSPDWLLWLPGLVIAVPLGLVAPRLGDRAVVLFGMGLLVAGGVVSAMAGAGVALLYAGRLMMGSGTVLVIVLLTKMMQVK